MTILFLTSIFSVGYHHFDEHFQILEFAGSKLGLTSPDYLPWEYQMKMRPAIQPAVVVVLWKLMNLVKLDNPFWIAFILRLVSGIFTFYAINRLYKLLQKDTGISIQDKKWRWNLLIFFLLWHIFYIGVRFSSENWSGLLFFLGFSHYFLSGQKPSVRLLITGIFIGLAFVVRYQTGFMALGFMAFLTFIRREKISHLIVMVFGITISGCIGILVDRWFYNEWTFTAYNYFDQNLLQDKVSNFGTEPWWWYIERFVLIGIPPLSLIIFAAIFYFIYKKWKHPITWTIIPFLLIHLLIGHKELRFLFPVVFFIPYILLYSLDAINKKWSGPILRIIVIINLIILPVIIFRPADPNIGLYKTIYDQYPEKTVLYHTGENPYHRVLDIQYYKRKNLRIEQISSPDKVPIGNNMDKLIVFNNKNKPETLDGKYKLIYSTFPEWMLKFNFNNWQSRARSWYVYDIEYIRK